MNDAKVWWASKTIWTNLIAFVGSIVIAIGFDPGRWAEIATVLLAAVNIALRLITKEEIVLDGETNSQS
jgi:hypothetical protein